LNPAHTDIYRAKFTLKTKYIPLLYFNVNILLQGVLNAR